MTNKIDVYTLDMNEAWSMFKIICTEKKTYNKVRYGLNIQFDINDYIKGRINIKRKRGLAIIQGKAYNIISFETELENREKQMKEWLISEWLEEEIVTGRQKKENNNEDE